MMFTADGKQTLVDIMSTYKNPFNVIVGSTLDAQARATGADRQARRAVDIKAHAAP